MNVKELRVVASLVLALGLLALVTVALPALAAPSGLRAASLDVVVSETAWMGTITSSDDEWIELYNNTASTVDLTGWTLNAADGTPSIALNGTIPAGSYFLLERTNDDSVPGVLADLTYSGELEKGGEDLVLHDAAFNVIDRVDCSSEWFAGHNEGRVPMVRVDTSAGGSLVSNWTHNPRCGTATNSAGISHTCTLTVTNVGQPLSYTVYFNERFTATTTTLDHTAMEDALLALIDDATTSIDVALYGLNRQSVVDALIAAHGAGVTVQPVIDFDAGELAPESIRVDSGQFLYTVPGLELPEPRPIEELPPQTWPFGRAVVLLTEGDASEDPTVQRAVLEAMDKDALLARAFPRQEVRFRSALGREEVDARQIPYDPELAGALLEEAGYARDVPAFLLFSEGDESLARMAEGMAEYLAKAGVEVELVPVAEEELGTMVSLMGEGGKSVMWLEWR